MWFPHISSFHIIASLFKFSIKGRKIYSSYIIHGSLSDIPSSSSVIFIARIMLAWADRTEIYRVVYFAYDAALIVTNDKKQAIRVWPNLISGTTNTQSAFYRPYLQATLPNYDESLSSAKRASWFEFCYHSTQSLLIRFFLRKICS